MQLTNYVIQMAPLSPTFRGGPSALARAIVERMRIVSPTGSQTFVIGDVEPLQNSGPWLKDGRQWYIWDDTIKRYVPLDITASERLWFHTGADTPTSGSPDVWLRLKDNKPLGWYWFDPSTETWNNFVGLIPAGDTRPANPEPFEMFYDTTISVLLWYERAKWRTVAGSPGDVKAVLFDTLADALASNPGWRYLGDVAPSMRGRIIMQATKDNTAVPVAQYTPPAGVAERAAKEVFGETDKIQFNASSVLPYPPQLALWHLYKE